MLTEQNRGPHHRQNPSNKLILRSSDFSLYFRFQRKESIQPSLPGLQVQKLRDATFIQIIPLAPFAFQDAGQP